MATNRIAMAAFLGLAGAAAANAATSPDTFNYQYRVYGDAQALPVQAFDDGEQLYIQIRDPATPPAAIGAAGPIPFKIRGHYLILPRTHAVTLRYGQYRADVMSEGGQGMSPGVVSITAPVDALARPQAAVLPVTRMVPQADALVVTGGIREAVTGQIEVGGARGLVTEADSNEAYAYRPAETHTVSYSDAVLPGSFSRYSSRIVSIGAGGTVAGVQAAQQAVNVCEGAGAICRVDYKAGTPGVLTLEIKEPR